MVLLSQDVQSNTNHFFYRCDSKLTEPGNHNAIQIITSQLKVSPECLQW